MSLLDLSVGKIYENTIQTIIDIINEIVYITDNKNFYYQIINIVNKNEFKIENDPKNFDQNNPGNQGFNQQNTSQNFNENNYNNNDNNLNSNVKSIS